MNTVPIEVSSQIVIALHKDGVTKFLKIALDVRVEGDAVSEEIRETLHQEFAKVADEWLTDVGMEWAMTIQGDEEVLHDD